MLFPKCRHTLAFIHSLSGHSYDVPMCYWAFWYEFNADRESLASAAVTNPTMAIAYEFELGYADVEG